MGIGSGRGPWACFPKCTAPEATVQMLASRLQLSSTLHLWDKLHACDADGNPMGHGAHLKLLSK